MKTIQLYGETRGIVGLVIRTLNDDLTEKKERDAMAVTSTAISYLTVAATGTGNTTAAYTSDLWLQLVGGQ